MWNTQISMMMNYEKLIDKDALVAELERRMNEYNTPIDRLGSNNIRLHECKDILSFLDTLEVKDVQEEFVSKDLKQAAITAADEDMQGRQIMEESNENRQLYSRIFRRGFKAGAKWQKEKLWKPADGDDLPEIDREVVAFQEIFPTDVDVPSLLEVVIAHRPNPKGYDGKSVTTGKVEHYTPMTYDKGGWSIPNVVWWLDCDFPKKEKI